MTRADAFETMKRATLPHMERTTIYGVSIESMTPAELEIALGWAISQIGGKK